jgi:polysaccharide biosynthesis transport protein
MNKQEASPLHDKPTFSTAAPDPGDLVGIAKRGWPLLLTGAALGVLSGLGLLVYMAPSYKASVKMVIEKSVNKYLQANKVADGPTMEDDSWSQLHVITSEAVLLPVIQKLDLAHDREFGTPAPGAQTGISIGKMIGEIKKLAGVKPPQSGTVMDGEAASLKAVSERLLATWEAQPSVINLTFESKDPVKAAAIANAVAESYVNSTVESKQRSAKLASKVLLDRLGGLKTQAADAEHKLLEFKLANNLTDVTSKTVSTEQLSSLSTHVANARLAMLDARSRLGSAPPSGDAATVTDIVDNALISRLREQYLEVEGRVNDLESRVGKRHAATIKLRKRLGELTAAMDAERRQIATSYALDLKKAEARYNDLNTSMAKAMTEETANSEVAARVRELESAADTLRSLYNATLQRVSEANKLEDQLLILPDARILTHAAVPSQTESSKKRLMVMAGSSLLGLALGAALVLSRHYPLGVFRTTGQVKQALGLMALMVPTVQSATGKKLSAMTDYALDMPNSRFAESFKFLWSLISRVQRENGAKVIGIVSSVAEEGKTTVAANLAGQVATYGGMRTLLIDADLVHQSLTRAMAPEAAAGLFEALATPARLEDFVVKQERSGVDVLAVPLASRALPTAQVLNSPKLQELLAAARASYDVIIIEMPPIAVVADAMILSRYCDGFVFVAEWGKTSQRLVIETFAECHDLWDRVLCVVLNKADPASLQGIEKYKGERYQAYYADR